MTDNLKAIKRAQRESLLFKEISKLFFQIVADDSQLQGITLNRVQLSPDKSVCSVYFYTPQGQAAFEKTLEHLKLYKPSLRTALAQNVRGRYTPDLIFKFDTQFEKEQRIQQVIDSIKVREE